MTTCADNSLILDLLQPDWNPRPSDPSFSYTALIVHDMADLQGRKVFKVFNQDFIVDERYNVTKELGQGAYGIVW